MLIAIAVFGLIVLLLKSQPDIGMLAVVARCFRAALRRGLNLVLVGIIGLGGVAGRSAPTPSSRTSAAA
jgi:cell division protein FtsW